MALPVPTVRSANNHDPRTKFMVNGMGFATLVAQWDNRIVNGNVPPSDDLDTPRGRRGDPNAVTHILYRIIEKDDDDLVVTDRNEVLADTVQHVGAWHPLGRNNVQYQDVVFPAELAEPTVDDIPGNVREHAVDMPNVVDVDATTKCYWVTAWLGVDAENILVGYDQTP